MPGEERQTSDRRNANISQAVPLGGQARTASPERFSGQAATAAESLIGTELPGGWQVIERAPTRKGAGFFSVGYVVERAGEIAFAKVLDYARALGESNDLAATLGTLGSAYKFERDLLDSCARLSNVVTLLDSGDYQVPGYGLVGRISYLIMERAEHDIRDVLDVLERTDVAVRLHLLHDVAVGITQLHRIGVAHQDLKPDNVLAFVATVAREWEAKLGDLGRASTRHQPGPNDDYAIPGDHAYAPIEQLYGYAPTEFAVRRLAGDAYALGNLIVFVFSGITLTPLIRAHLRPEHRWDNFFGTYAEALPFVEHAFAASLENVRTLMPVPVKEELTSLIQQLCEPDPIRRGLSGNHASARYDLRRVVSHLDRLSHTAAIDAVQARSAR